MYALAINGSPRKGNTDALLDTVLAPISEAGWKTEKIQVGGKPVRGCIACRKCFENKDMKCILTEDLFNDLFAKIAIADALIIGSPTYFTDVSAETKAVLDRTGYVALANGGVLRGTIGGAVVAVRRGGATHVYDTINHMYQMNEMILPGSTYWNMGYGLKPAEALDDAEGVNNMKHLGNAIVWLGKAISQMDTPYPAGR